MGQPNAVSTQPKTWWPESSARRVISASTALFSSWVMFTLARLWASLAEMTMAISSTP